MTKFTTAASPGGIDCNCCSCSRSNFLTELLLLLSQTFWGKHPDFYQFLLHFWVTPSVIAQWKHCGNQRAVFLADWLVCVSLCLSACVSMCLFVCVSVCLCIYVSVCLCVRLCVYPSVYPSVCLFVCVSIRLCVYPSVCLSVCVSVHLSVRLSICPSVCLSVCPSVCLSVCLSASLNNQ